MTDTQTSTAEPSQAELRNQMRDAAEAADRGEDVNPLESLPKSASESGEGKAQNTEDRASGKPADQNQETDNPESSAETKTEDSTQPRNDKGQFLKKEDGQQEQQDKPESNYSKAKKDADRYDRNWRKFQEEKTAFERDRAEFYKSQSQRPQTQPQQQQSGQPRFSAKDYETAAVEFDKQAQRLIDEGDLEGAKAQLGLASQARAAAQHYSQIEQSEARQGTMTGEQKKWEGNLNQIIEETPELRDPSSEMGQKLNGLLSQYPVLQTYGDGIKHAYELLKLQKDAAEASGLRDKLTNANKEIERLTQLVNPQGPKGSAKHSSPSSIDNMSLNEQRVELRRQAEQADGVV